MPIDVRLVRTCYACPEQYDVFLGEEKIGYLRLRHGTFTADHPDPEGVTVYQANTQGDGIFDPDEREEQLNAAVLALLRRHLGDSNPVFLIEAE